MNVNMLYDTLKKLELAKEVLILEGMDVSNINKVILEVNVKIKELTHL